MSNNERVATSKQIVSMRSIVACFRAAFSCGCMANNMAWEKAFNRFSNTQQLTITRQIQCLKTGVAQGDLSNDGIDIDCAILLFDHNKALFNENIMLPVRIRYFARDRAAVESRFEKSI